MSPRPLLLFVVAIALAAAGVAEGVALFAQKHREAAQDRLHAAAYELAADAVAWARTPTVLGGGEGTDALSDLDFERLGLAPEHDASGAFVRVGASTLRVQNAGTEAPFVEATSEDGLTARVAVYGPGAACLAPAALGAAPTVAARPTGCAGWR